jgi:type VI secretion system protein ImpA
MPSPEVLDFGKLLAPVPGEKPTGSDLRADASPTSPYYATKDARSAARAAERQLVTGNEKDMPPDWKPPDWRPVYQNATKVLTEKSKDLEVTAYLIEALVRLHGFPGLRDGFRLARELVEKYWDGLYPVPDEEGPMARLAALVGLNGEDGDGTLIVPIARVPITEATSAGRLASSHYHQGQSLNKLADAKLREKKVAEGAMSPEKFLKAIQETPPKFFAALVEDLNQASEEYAKLCSSVEARCNGNAPPSSNIRQALTACLDLVKDVARDKLAQAAAQQAPPAAKAAGDGKAGDGKAAPAVNVVQEHIRSREEAFASLIKLAEFFRQTEPHTPVSYALEQAVRWGRMSFPELMAELVPDEAPRKSLYRQVGVRPPEPPPKEAKK